MQKHPEYLEEFDAIAKDHTAGIPQDFSVKWLNLTIAKNREKLKKMSASRLTTALR